MIFLPIVQRELRVQARQKRTYRLRLFAASIAIAMVAFMLSARRAVGGPDGSGLFWLLGWVSFIYCLVAGAGATADCLSEEKREGTLGLLFLTDLKGYDVVLGKLLAISLNNFYGLVAIFPPLGITLLLGGVTAGEFWRLALLLINTLFLSVAIGMLISSMSRSEQRAWAGTFGGVLLLAGLPLFTGFELFDLRYHFHPALFWKGLLSMHSLSWVLLAVAGVILPRAWQDQPLSDSNRSGSRRLDIFLGRLSERHFPNRSARLLDTNPATWLAARQGLSTKRYLWLTVITASTVGLLAAFFAPGWPDGMPVFFLCAVALHLLLATWTAFQASHLIAEARRSGTLELLLCAPLSANQILEGYFEGLRQTFAQPVAVLLLFAVLLGEVLLLTGKFTSAIQGVPLLLIGGGFWALLFISDLYTVARVGMWLGLASKKPAQAFGKTVLYVLILPVFTVCCSVLMPVMWLMKNGILMNHAQEKLRHQFRAILSEGTALSNTRRSHRTHLLD